jgi:hypothetical protein
MHERLFLRPRKKLKEGAIDVRRAQTVNAWLQTKEGRLWSKHTPSLGSCRSTMLTSLRNSLVPPKIIAAMLGHDVRTNPSILQ